MPNLPFEIPESLVSYAEHFDEEPIKATTRLKKQLEKRGPDAVGHFLLAWFYHLKGMDQKAVEEALKARIFAPGSPFFKRLHYYLSHPQKFEAWLPEDHSSSSQRNSQVKEHGPVLNLDLLIQKLSAVESQRIKPDNKNRKASQVAADGSSEDVDDIASETLATIHEKQGKIDEAIRTYEQLQKLNKDKKEYYSDKIASLKEKKEKKE